METWSRAPALLPALASILGVTAGLAAPGTPTGAVVVLGLLGVALAAPSKSSKSSKSSPPGAAGWGLAVAAGALGLLVGACAGAPQSAPDPARPVRAVVAVSGHWRELEEGWSAPVRILRLRQGRAVETRTREATLRLPGAGPPPPLGSRLRVRGFLRRAPGLGNVPPLPPGRWRLTTKSRRLVSVVNGAGVVASLASALRRRAEAAIDQIDAASDGLGGAPGPNEREEGGEASHPLGSALARALVLGDASRVPLPVRQGLRRLGLAHVLAVSGLHVGLVAGILLALGAGLPRVPRLALGLAGVALYLLLVGPRASLLRASIMAGLATMALLAERPPQVLNALAVAAAGLCLTDPRSLMSVGFQLTVAATAGIVLLGPRLDAAWRGGRETGDRGRASRTAGRSRLGARLRTRLGTGARRAVAASVGAQLGVMPWAVPAFSLLTPWAPLANLAAVPWTGLTLAVDLVWVAVASVAPGPARACHRLLDLMAAPFAWPAAIPPRPWIDVPVSMDALEAGLTAAGLFVLLGGAGGGWRQLARRAVRLRPGVAAVTLAGLVALGLRAGAMAAAGGARAEARPARAVHAVMIDVGQGDAILLRDGPHAALVDGGGWRYGDLGGRVLLPVLARLGVRRLDAVIVSHPDRDHCGGLVDIAGYLAVGEVVSAPGIGDSRCGRDLARLARVDRAVVRREVGRGAVLSVGRWRLRSLHPAPVPNGAAGDGRGRPSARGSDNDRSLVLRAEAFGRRLLLTGDIESRTERTLVRTMGEALPCDLLKVAHHGSKTSTTGPFLAAAAPRVALISAGAKNPYGHPAGVVLDRLAARGVRIVRTDRDGMVEVSIGSDGRMTLALPGAPKR